MSPHRCEDCLRDRIARMADSKRKSAAEHSAVNGMQQENGDSGISDTPCELSIYLELS